jgi:hypothetical protein
MHVLFFHPNFPAQFRCIAPRLARDHGWTVTFATRNNDVQAPPGVNKVLYVPSGRATAANSPFTRRTLKVADTLLA